MSVKVLGQTLQMPIYCSPTALQRLFHHDGERAVAAAAAKFGTMFGVSRSEEHTSELQSLMRISYAVFCLKKKNTQQNRYQTNHTKIKQRHNKKKNTTK